jgi:hypothetical protein
MAEMCVDQIYTLAWMAVLKVVATFYQVAARLIRLQLEPFDMRMTLPFLFPPLCRRSFLTSTMPVGSTLSLERYFSAIICIKTIKQLYYSSICPRPGRFARIPVGLLATR